MNVPILDTKIDCSQTVCYICHEKHIEVNLHTIFAKESNLNCIECIPCFRNKKVFFDTLTLTLESLVPLVIFSTYVKQNYYRMRKSFFVLSTCLRMACKQKVSAPISAPAIPVPLLFYKYPMLKNKRSFSTPKLVMIVQ